MQSKFEQGIGYIARLGRKGCDVMEALGRARAISWPVSGRRAVS